MNQSQSSLSQLGILLVSRMVFDLDFQVITLFFSTFNETFQIEVWVLGFLLSLYSLISLLSPLFGNLSDKYGRKQFIIGGLFTFALSSLIMVIAQNWLHLIISRALAGLSIAMYFPALYAELGDKFSYERRTRAIGIVRLAWPITFIIGVPLVGYSIEKISWRLPFLILSILAFCIGIFILFRSPSESHSQIQTVDSQSTVIRFKLILLNRSVLAGLIMMFLAVGSIEGLFAFFPIWMELQFLIGEATISLIFAFMGVGTLLGTLLAVGIGDKLGPKRSAVGGLIIAALLKVTIPYLKFSLLAITIGILLLGLFFDFAMTALPALLTQLAPEAKGTVMSVNQALTSANTAIMYSLSGILWIRSSYEIIGLVFGSMTLLGSIIGLFNIPNKSEISNSNN